MLWWLVGAFGSVASALQPQVREGLRFRGYLAQRGSAPGVEAAVECEGRSQGLACVRGEGQHDWVCLSSSPRGGAGSARSFEPILATLLFSCALALHARQVDVKLRLDYLWAAQARLALLLLGEGQVRGPGWIPASCEGGAIWHEPWDPGRTEDNTAGLEGWLG